MPLFSSTRRRPLAQLNDGSVIMSPETVKMQEALEAMMKAREDGIIDGRSVAISPQRATPLHKMASGGMGSGRFSSEAAASPRECQRPVSPAAAPLGSTASIQSNCEI